MIPGFNCSPTETVYRSMHANYDELGEKDGLVSYEEIKRALGSTTEEEWKKEIELHDDGDKLLDPTGLNYCNVRPKNSPIFVGSFLVFCLGRK